MNKLEAGIYLGLTVLIGLVIGFKFGSLGVYQAAERERNAITEERKRVMVLSDGMKYEYDRLSERARLLDLVKVESLKVERKKIDTLISRLSINFQNLQYNIVSLNGYIDALKRLQGDSLYIQVPKEFGGLK